MANKQLKNHFRAYEAMQLDAHFEERDLKFKQMELDPVTGQSNGIKWSGFVSSCHVCMYVCLSICLCACLSPSSYVYSITTDHDDFFCWLDFDIPDCGLIRLT